MLHVRFLLLAQVSLLASGIHAGYRNIKHPHNSSQTIRVKEHADGVLCNGGGNHFTGWTDIGDRHLFFWYHPARHVQAKDAPLLIWLSGGPGASSMIGMLMLHGPCLLDLEIKTTKFNPEAWTESFNVIYLDQPAGTGFSYVNDSENPNAYPERNEESSKDFIAAIELLRLAFDDLDNVPLYLTGESYAGQYVPIYGAAILDHNARLQGGNHVPLVSIIIGNAMVSPSAQFPALYDTSCSEYDSIAPLLNETECAKMAPIAARCELLADACAAFPDDVICGPVGEYCEPALKGLLSGSGHHPWDRTLDCKAPTTDACYPMLKGITDLFAVPEILKHLDVDKQTEGKALPFNVVSGIIDERYSKTGGLARTSIPALTKLINYPSVDVMIYVGVNDWIANPLGVRRYLDNMRFEGYLEFRNEARLFLPWKTKEGQSGGMIKRIDGLWHVELAGSGHMFPYDQPHSALKLMEAWREEVESKQRGNGKLNLQEFGSDSGRISLAIQAETCRGKQMSSKNPFEQDKAFKSEI